MGGVQRLFRAVQRIVEPRRADRRVEQRRARREPVGVERRSGLERRDRERRAAF